MRSLSNFIRAALLTIALVFILAGGLIAYHFMDGLSAHYSVFGSEPIDVTKTGAVGDFVAGVVGTILSFAGIILVLLTYVDQRRSNERSNIEARIFTLIQIHVNNAENVSYQNPYRNGN